MIFGTIKVNKNIIIKNSPVDQKFWDIYRQCCNNEMLGGVELIKKSKTVKSGYSIFFDPIDMTASVVSYRIRRIKLNEEYKTKKECESVQ